MRKIREVLRGGVRVAHSGRAAQSCRMGKGTVGIYLRRASAKGLGWPLPEDMDDRALEGMLFPKVSSGSAQQLSDNGFDIGLNPALFGLFPALVSASTRLLDDFSNVTNFTEHRPKVLG